MVSQFCSTSFTWFPGQGWACLVLGQWKWMTYYPYSMVNDGYYMVNINGYDDGYYMVNNNLVGGWPTHLKNDGVRQGWWTYQFMEKNVPNHQPVAVSPTNSEPMQQWPHICNFMVVQWTKHVALIFATRTILEPWKRINNNELCESDIQSFNIYF